MQGDYFGLFRCTSWATQSPLNPLMTGYDPYFLPSVNMMQNWIVLATWDKFETPLLCNARVTILVHFGEPHGCPPYPPHEWF